MQHFFSPSVVTVSLTIVRYCQLNCQNLFKAMTLSETWTPARVKSCALPLRCAAQATCSLSLSFSHTCIDTHTLLAPLGPRSHQHLQSVGLFRRNKADIYCRLSLSVKAQICGAHKPHLPFLPVKI